MDIRHVTRTHSGTEPRDPFSFPRRPDFRFNGSRFLVARCGRARERSRLATAIINRAAVKTADSVLSLPSLCLVIC